MKAKIFQEHLEKISSHSGIVWWTMKTADSMDMLIQTEIPIKTV